MTANKGHIAWCICTTAIILALALPEPAAGFLYHSTGKAIAKRMIARGINPSKFSARTRFGKGFYASRKPSTALAEKGAVGNKVVRLRESTFLKKNTVNVTNPTPAKLHSLLGPNYDLRGAVKQKIIGPKAGREVGEVAAKQGKSVQYRSARNSRSNVFIPKKVVESRPRIVHPEKIFFNVTK